jgi:hypothetical protein
VIIFGISGLGVFGRGNNITKTKLYKNFNTFADLELLELEVPMFCLVIPCVSARRDARYRRSEINRKYQLESELPI